MRRNGKLRYLLGEIYGYALIYSGIARLFLNRRLARGEATAFFLHDPEQQVFEQVMLKARRWGFEFVNDAQLLDHIGGVKLSKRPLLHISIDDGWRRNLRNVAEFAEREHIPITYFIATEAVETGTFWWDRVPDRATAARLRSVPNHERMAYLAGLHGGTSPAPLSGHDAGRTAMTSDEIGELARMKHATIGNHTHNHPVFSHCTDEEIDAELSEAHRRLTAMTGTKPDAFAYPCGSLNGHDYHTLQRLAYRIAYTTEPRGILVGESNHYDIPRFEDNRHGGVAENFCRLIGLWQTIYHALRLRYKGVKRLVRGGLALRA